MPDSITVASIKVELSTRLPLVDCSLVAVLVRRWHTSIGIELYLRTGELDCPRIEALPQKLITFDFKPTKFVNVVAFFAESCSGSTKKKICKLLYFSDKEHLLKYGTTITGDAYYHLKHGPIPTYGLDLLRGKGRVQDLELTKSFLEVKGMDVKAKRQLDSKVFSKSEISTLEQIKRLYGGLSADSLERLSHLEPAWKKSRQSERIDFGLFFDGHPEAKVAREIAESESEERIILARYRAES